MEVPGAGGDTVLLYGHCDKQPEMVGWAEDGGPWTPVRRGDRLFGRGAGDDGYAAFAALTAIEALQAQGIPHARCVVLIEACEESGSHDLPDYVETLADRIGPDLVVCLDSGCGNYEQLWATTSLRGVLSGISPWRCWTRACTPARPAASCRRASASCASCSTGSRTIAPARSSRGLPRRDPARARWPRRARSPSVLGDDVCSRFPFLPGMRPVTTGPGRAAAEQHVAARARDHRRRRVPALADARQRAAAEDLAQALAAAAADRGRRRARCGGSRSCSRPIRPTARA